MPTLNGNMENNNQDQTSKENGTEDQTSKETAGEKTPEKTTEEEDTIPKSKFVASQTEAIRLKKELDTLKETQKEDIPEEEKKIRETLQKVETEKEEQVKQEQEQLRSELDKLHEVHGEFDEKKLMKIADHYGCYDDDDNVNWSRSMELYNTPGIAEKATGSKVSPAPKKTPSSDRTTDQPKKEEFDPTKVRDLSEIAEEAKKQLRGKE